ncbi:MAG: RlmF-related methyltransferase, partial [Bacteroidota bacterium]
KENYVTYANESKIKCLDVGVGANCIYPLIGNKEYGWSFIGSDIDAVSLGSADKIIELNQFLKGRIELRLQNNARNIFKGIIRKAELIDLTICNPPFHASLEDAQSGTLRKLNNLTRTKNTKTTLNFGGQGNELWCNGGEEKFIEDLIHQSMQFATSCLWFSTLVSKKSNLKSAYDELRKAEAVEIKTIPMGQGNKTSRIVAWTFQVKEQQKSWMNERWNQPRKPSRELECILPP